MPRSAGSRRPSPATRIRGVSERLPHAPALLAKPLIKLGHAGFRTVLAAEPDRAFTNEVADHDPVDMAFADRDLVNADHDRPWGSCLGELSAHVLLVQLLDRVSIKLELLGHIPDRGTAAAPADVNGKPLGIEWVVRETWLLVLSGGARTGSFDVTIGDAVFVQSDRVNIHAGTIGMVGLVAYTGGGQAPHLLQRVREPSAMDSGRPQEVQVPTSFPQAKAVSANGRPEITQ
jgi:hypothetical protein